MAKVLWDNPNPADQPTWSPSLASLASGAYSLSSVIDNTTGLFENALISLVLPSAVTAGSGAPFVGFTMLYSEDGTTYPTPPGASAGATGVPQTASVPAVASASFTQGVSLPFLIAPFKFKILMVNSLGVAFPASGTFTVNLRRWAETVA
jgi:hypothetical protein